MELIRCLLFFLLYIMGNTGEPIIGIRNGVPAINLEKLFMVSIRIQNFHSCGGTIISEYWVLTAGHCIARNNSVYTILYGTLKSYDGKVPPLTKTREVSRTELHPDFKRTRQRIQNDVGLLLVHIPFKLDRYINILELPPKGAPIEHDEHAKLYGWGLLKEGARSIPEHLQQLQLIADQRTDCETVIPITSNEFCAGGGGCGPCIGDSGSPLISNGVQIGILSIGRIPCGEKASIFQRVSAHKEWIDLYVLNYKSPFDPNH